VADVDALLAQAGLAGAEKRILVVTGTEKVARFIASLGPILLMLGLLGIYVEIKTPGLGLPGILGGICVALFFWGHHIAGLSGSEEILLFIIGLILVVAEVIFMHTGGLLALVGTGLMLTALFMAMVDLTPVAPALVESEDPRIREAFSRIPDLKTAIAKLSAAIIGAGFLGALVARYLPKSRLVHPIVLHTAENRDEGYAASDSTAALIGQTGVAVTPLRPGGSILIGDRRIDVMARNEYLPAGARVRVTAAEGSRVFVEPADGPAAS
jgi:membrane-bound serine protease (ClpP class)